VKGERTSMKAGAVVKEQLPAHACSQPRVITNIGQHVHKHWSTCSQPLAVTNISQLVFTTTSDHKH
jgi:hypothetical protein